MQQADVGCQLLNPYGLSIKDMTLENIIILTQFVATTPIQEFSQDFEITCPTQEYSIGSNFSDKCP